MGRRRSTGAMRTGASFRPEHLPATMRAENDLIAHRYRERPGSQCMFVGLMAVKLTRRKPGDFESDVQELQRACNIHCIRDEGGA
jgi:hypothetical protein